MTKVRSHADDPFPVSIVFFFCCLQRSVIRLFVIECLIRFEAISWIKMFCYFCVIIFDHGTIQIKWYYIQLCTYIVWKLSFNFDQKIKINVKWAVAIAVVDTTYEIHSINVQFYEQMHEYIIWLQILKYKTNKFYQCILFIFCKCIWS